MKKTQSNMDLINHAQLKLTELCNKYQIKIPDLYFDLKGKTAGLAYWPHNYIRINFDLFLEHPEVFFNEIIPHELCHIWKAQLNLPGRPHGPHWQRLMQKMGAKATRTHDLPIDHLKTRQLKQFFYSCTCRDHELTSIRHNRILAGREYRCRKCGNKLTYKKN